MCLSWDVYYPSQFLVQSNFILYAINLEQYLQIVPSCVFQISPFPLSIPVAGGLDPFVGLLAVWFPLLSPWSHHFVPLSWSSLKKASFAGESHYSFTSSCCKCQVLLWLKDYSANCSRESDKR